MHRFLRTVGFREYQKKHDIRHLIRELTACAEPGQIRRLNLDGETNLCEVRVETAPDMGLAIYGEMDENGEIDPEYYVPYVTGREGSSDAECSFQRHTDRETCAGMLDEFKVGISLIFYLDNIMDLREKMLAGESVETDYVSLNGLASTGKILLPVRKTSAQREKARVAAAERDQLLEAARKGDEEAMETLTVEDIDLYAQVSRRVMKEDIYSVVETCFMPAGVECDQYQIIGDITRIDREQNRFTGEGIYRFGIACNHMHFDVVINEKDLLGEPKVGRRFKGQIWMMGTAYFRGHSDIRS